MSVKQYYRPNEFAKLIGVSIKTLQRWDVNGKLPAFRTPGDRRYYTYEQYLKYVGKEPAFLIPSCPVKFKLLSSLIKTGLFDSGLTGLKISAKNLGLKS